VVAKAGQSYDYDLVIIGCGVGGHGAALHAVECVHPPPPPLFSKQTFIYGVVCVTLTCCQCMGYQLAAV